MKTQGIKGKFFAYVTYQAVNGEWGGEKNTTVLTNQSYLKRFLLTPIQKLTISIQRLALCPNTNYV